MSKLLVAAMIATVGGAGAVGTVALRSEPTDAASRVTVERVVDGDTVDILINGTRERVRLLNVDAPETKHPTRPVECLGLEAAAYLIKVLPKGATVTLEHDVERRDRYGRTLAGVRLSDGTLVNAMLASRGLAVPVVYGKNRKFYPAVVKAREEAETNRVGFFGASNDCTVPARMVAADTMVGKATSTSASPGDSKAATTAVTSLTADLGASAPGLEVRALSTSKITAARRTIAALTRQLGDAKKVRPSSSERARPTAARTTKAREATPTPTAARQRERRSTAHATPPPPRPKASQPRTAHPRSPRNTPPPAPPTAKPPAQERPSNAAPCRSYAPGGKSWAPIPCP